MRIIDLKKVSFVMFICLLSTGCCGTLKVNVPNKYNKAIRTLFVSERDTSYKVPATVSAGFLGGAVGGILIGLASKDMKEYEVPAIGNTYLHIKSVLEKFGYTVVSGNPETITSDIDVVVDYYDYWVWDVFKYYLKMLKITFKEPITGFIIAEAQYTAAVTHDYPSSEREVPKLISNIIAKLQSE